MRHTTMIIIGLLTLSLSTFGADSWKSKKNSEASFRNLENKLTELREQRKELQTHYSSANTLPLRHIEKDIENVICFLGELIEKYPEKLLGSRTEALAYWNKLEKIRDDIGDYDYYTAPDGQWLRTKVSN